MAFEGAQCLKHRLLCAGVALHLHPTAGTRHQAPGCREVRGWEYQGALSLREETICVM